MKQIKLVALFVMLASAAFAQGTLGKGSKQLNAGVGFSNWGTPIYVGLDFGVHESITIGPKFSYRKHNDKISTYEFNETLIVIGFNGNYHFNQLLSLPEPLDIYAGLTIGYYIWSVNEYSGPGSVGHASGIGLDAQIGIRYFLSDKFGLNLEFGGGYGSGGSFGVTVKL